MSQPDRRMHAPLVYTLSSDLKCFIYSDAIPAAFEELCLYSAIVCVSCAACHSLMHILLSCFCTKMEQKGPVQIAT